MEHRALTVTGPLELAAKNLVKTYTAIGSATPGASVQRHSDIVLCRCSIEHAVGNFALAGSVDPNQAAWLSEIASPCRGFNVYVLAGADRGTVLALQGAGFQRTYRLAQMISQEPRGAVEIELGASRTPEERSRTASFMVDQFFHRQPAQTRSDIAKATAGCGLDLYEVRNGGRAMGAVMVCESEGALGIYNLCIQESLRGRGFGSKASRTLLAMAEAYGALAVLQCEKSLVPWYRSLGFQKQGSVDVYTLGTKVIP